MKAIEILNKLEANNYFKNSNYDPNEFYKIVEYKLNIGRDKALDLLLNEQLVKIEYSDDPSIHPREKMDYWRLIKNNH